LQIEYTNLSKKFALKKKTLYFNILEKNHLNEESHIFKLRFQKYIADNTVKRLNTLIPIAILLLVVLIFTDIYIRHSIPAVYSRIFSLSLAVFLYLHNKIRPKASTIKVVLYNIFLASIPAMMFAKYLIHYDTDTNTTNVMSIIIAVFIIALEVRTNFFYSLLIYLIPPVIFIIILHLYFPVSEKEQISLINIFIILIVSFFINQVQNNFRFKTYVSNYLLNIEKKKLEESVKNLNHYKKKLEDMVEKKTLSLKYALEKAKKSDALKTQFLLNISHELRTPMNAVLGFSDIVSKKNPELKKEYEIIENNLNLLLNTIENILLLSKLQSDQIGSELSSFSITEFNKSLFNQLKKDIYNSKKPISAEFINQISDDLVFNSDKHKLEIIFKQVFDNAVKYTDKGTIELMCEQISENEIQYSVSDTGIGISPNELPHIFDTFRKAEKKDKLFGGTGIGLSIAKQLTELLKGQISAKINQNKGTTIVILLKISVSS